MKQFVTFLAIAVLAVACEKSTIENEKQVGAATEKVAGLIGTWKLVAFWQDAGNGTGNWVSADFTELISFGAEGNFTSSPSFPLYPRGYTSFVAKESQIAFYPSTSSNGMDDVYSYSLQNSVLTFYPRCRETCTRVYQLVN
jgi:hypothetical protein